MVAGLKSLAAWALANRSSRNGTCLARFVAANHLVIPEARDADDPNAAVYADARRRAEAIALIQGFLVKPLDAATARTLLSA